MIGSLQVQQGNTLKFECMRIFILFLASCCICGTIVNCILIAEFRKDIQLQVILTFVAMLSCMGAMGWVKEFFKMDTP